MTDLPCLELATFRLKPGTDEAAFLAAARATEAALDAFGRPLSRVLARGEDGAWTDAVLWPDRATALRAA
ncbi:MAG: hypothetical protein ACU0CO_11295, partial [Shimia sp.]